MSPAALELAIEVLEADVEKRQELLEQAVANAARADDLVRMAAERQQEAAERLDAAQEALIYLQGLQEPREAAEGFEDEQ